MRDAVAFHVAFGVVCGIVLLLPVPALGWRIAALVLGYHVALPAVARLRGHEGWIRVWSFLLVLSVCLVIPDSALVEIVGSLDFPDLGGPRLGPAPLAMAGMWSIPLWIVVVGADVQRGSRASRMTWAAGIGLVIFVGAEALLPLLSLWEPVGVWTVGTVALYVIGPEMLLSAVTYLAFDLTRQQPFATRAASAALVSLVYLGALVASYYVLDGAG